jgi:hypothetical protein
LDGLAQLRLILDRGLFLEDFSNLLELPLSDCFNQPVEALLEKARIIFIVFTACISRWLLKKLSLLLLWLSEAYSSSS